MSNSFSENDIQQVWKEMANEKFKNNSLEKIEIMNAISSQSLSLISTLKKGLKTKFTWSALIIFVFLYISYAFSDDPQMVWFHLVLSFIYAIGSFLLYWQYKKMDDKLDSDQSILQSLTSNKKSIKRALLIERIWGVLAILMVFIFYTQRWSHKNIDDPSKLVWSISTFLIIILIVGAFAEWGNKKQFGNRIKKLEENIIRLETLN